MTIRLRIMGIMTMLCSMLGCTAQTEGFESIGSEEFELIIADTAKVVRLDVRTAEEYAEGHIDGAVNIDVLKDDFEGNTMTKLPKDKTIAVYCRSGKRSKKAAGILVKQGFNVVELNCGYMGWTKAGKPVVR
ncbi:MAG: rhodanese-like domain-containing protein [Prevotella sp.]|nr:rhodanese-like domain-containing protein [Prevotella sp.]